MTETKLTPQQIADELMKHDHASRSLGMQVQSISEGTAVITMPITKDKLNGHAICHGGLIFSLADTAFAFACNSRNRKTLALSCTINFIAPAHEGDILTATAKEVSLAGRTGIYDITVTNQSAATIAHFRGTSYGTSSPAVDV